MNSYKMLPLVVANASKIISKWEVSRVCQGPPPHNDRNPSKYITPFGDEIYCYTFCIRLPDFTKRIHTKW